MGREAIQECWSDGCDNDAVVYPVFLIPPKGAPNGFPDEKKIRSPFRLPLCDGCADELDPSEFFTTQKQRDLIEKPLRAIGRTAPDFKRTTVTFIDIEEGEAIFKKTHDQ